MIEFELRSPRPQGAVAAEAFHTWTLPDGSLWLEFYRATTGGYVLRFPGFGDFAVAADGRKVDAFPVADVSASTVEHLYLNQVLPLAMSRMGMAVFHGSAAIIDGHAVAFLGPSGRGKSTLAANFAVRGHRFLTDDGLILEPSDAGFRILPSHPSIRLWDDSHSILENTGAAVAPPVSYTSKSRFLAGGKVRHSEVPAPLAVAYFLSDRPVDSVRFTRLAASAALIEWTKHAFLLDTSDPRLIGDLFENAARLANAVPSFELDFRRRYEDVEQLIAEIIDHAISQTDAP